MTRTADGAAPRVQAASAGALCLIGAALVAGAMLAGARPPARVAPPLRHHVDLNAADAGELSLLPGVGPALAGRIEESRRREGPFATVEDLRRVKGIGPATLERVRPWVTAGVPGATLAPQRP